MGESPSSRGGSYDHGVARTVLRRLSKKEKNGRPFFAKREKRQKRVGGQESHDASSLALCNRL